MATVNEPVPGWLAAGSPVVIVHDPRMGAPIVTETAVKKINTKSVTLENGVRFPLSGGGPDHLHKYGQGWDPGSDLYPPDAEAVSNARRAIRLDRARARALAAVDKVRVAAGGKASAEEVRVASAALAAWADLLSAEA